MQIVKKVIQNRNVLHQQDAVNLATQFVELLKKENNLVIEKAVLFGSFAKQKNHEYSDIDLALWSDGFSGVSFLDYKFFSSIKYKNKAFSEIECHTFSPKFSNPLEEEILKTGIELNLI